MLLSLQFNKDDSEDVNLTYGSLTNKFFEKLSNEKLTLEQEVTKKTRSFANFRIVTDLLIMWEIERLPFVLYATRKATTELLVHFLPARL